MFGRFKKKLDPAKTRKVLLQERDDSLHVATATLVDCGWVAKDAYGELNVLLKSRLTTGNHRIVAWFPHTGWDVECFLEEVDS
jgi:hypothetical protein